MAALSSAIRREVAVLIAQGLSSTHESCGITKVQLLAAINAADDWADANAAAYNAALPQPARSVLTAAQKARILAMVILKRWEVS